MMRLFRAALGTNNIDHCTRLCHSTSVAAMQRALNTSAASGSMREVEHAADVIFIAGANTTESHPVFGAAIKRAHERGATLIVADPRQTELAARADIHLQRSEEHTSELQSQSNLVCRLLLEKKKKINRTGTPHRE